MLNIRSVYSNGDRSESQRRLIASELKLRLPDINQEKLKAIEYIVPSLTNRSGFLKPEDSIISGYDSKKVFLPSSRFNIDSINESTKDCHNNSKTTKESRARPGEQEQTTGWHF